jgi:hypothetical protein
MKNRISKTVSRSEALGMPGAATVPLLIPVVLLRDL